MKPQSRWRSSEKIALEFLKNQGFEIMETNKKITIDGVEVSEVDAIAIGPSGEKYAVEIKAGKIDVNGIRQAIINADLAGAKPLIIAKGFADEAAEALARKYNVKTFLLSDTFLVDAEELEIIVETALINLLEKIIDILYVDRIKPEHAKIVRAIATSRDAYEAAQKLGMTIKELYMSIKKMKEDGIIPPRLSKYSSIRFAAKLLILKNEIYAKIEKVEELINKMETLLS